MKNKLLILLVAIFTLALCAFGISACKKSEPDNGVDIVSAYIQDGDLLLILSNGEYINCGNVTGTDGVDGIDGIDGVGITDIRYNEDGDLVIAFADGVIRIVQIAPKVCEHTFSEWLVESPADCVTQGYRYRTCSKCGYFEHEIVAATGHNWDHDHADVLIERETCTDCGWEVLTCSYCGETCMSKIEPTTHRFTEVFDYADGTVSRMCLDCGMLMPSSGLEFKKGVTYSSSYILSGLGTCTDEHIVVPDVIETQYGTFPVTGVDRDVFAGSNIKSVYFSKNITNIEAGNGMFANCLNMTEIFVHQKNTVYRSDGNCIVDMYNKTVIAGCATSTLPSDGSVTTVGPFAFYGVYGLTKLVVPDKIVTLGTYAYGKCVGLRELTLGGETCMLTTIDTECFYGCAGLEKVTLINVPSIGQSAFENCASLKEVVIDKGCQRIRGYAFAACTSLETVRISSTVTRIDSGAFGACQNLTDLYYQGSKSTWNDIIDSGATWNSNPIYYPTLPKTPITDDDIHYNSF